MKNLKDYLILESVSVEINNLDLFHEFICDAITLQKRRNENTDWDTVDKNLKNYYSEKWDKFATIINTWFDSNKIEKLDDITGEYMGIDKDGICDPKIPDNYLGLDKIVDKIKLEYNNHLDEDISSIKFKKVALTNNGSYSSYKTFTFGVSSDNKKLYIKFKSNATDDPYIRGVMFLFVKK